MAQGREAEHLAQAERHIVENAARIVRQLDLIARLRAVGGDVALAEALLATLEQVQTLAVEHRATILAEIDRRPGAAAPRTAT